MPNRDGTGPRRAQRPPATPEPPADGQAPDGLRPAGCRGQGGAGRGLRRGRCFGGGRRQRGA